MKSSVMRILLSALAVTALHLVPVRSAEAQEHANALSANPFLLLAEWFNVEYERAFSPTSAFAVTVSRIDIDDNRYTSANALYRYYPSGEAMRGFYFGPRLGLVRVEDDTSDGTAAGFGFELGYNWLLGVDDNFLIGMGIGANRLFGGDLDDGSVFIPTLRLVNVGWAF